jgi:hypothetical protein
MSNESIDEGSEQKSVGAALGIGILLLPFVFAWLTLRKGYSKVARIVSLGWMALIVIVLVFSSNNDGSSVNQNDLDTLAENSQSQDVASDLNESAAGFDAEDQPVADAFPADKLNVLARCNVLANGMSSIKQFLYMKSAQGLTYTDEERAQDALIVDVTNKEIASVVNSSKANGYFKDAQSIVVGAQSDLQSQWNSVQNSPNSSESINSASEIINYYTNNCLSLAA